MDPLMRGRRLLEDIGEFVHGEIMVRITMVQELRTVETWIARCQALLPRAPAGLVPLVERRLMAFRARVALDGRTYPRAQFPIGVLRHEIGALVRYSSGIAFHRDRAAVDVRQGLLLGNRLMTEFIDKLDGWPTGFLLRSDRLGEKAAARGWLHATNVVVSETIVELEIMMDDRDTDRPVRGPQE